MKPGRIRAVFDCNTLVQAVAFETSPAAAALHQVESGIVELFVSRRTLAELRRVLAYEEIVAISPRMTPENIGAFLRRLMFRATLARRVRHVFDYSRDPTDEPYVDLAIGMHVDYLVSRDKDLLSLMSGHSVACKQFRQKAGPLRVVTPEEFLRASGH